MIWLVSGIVVLVAAAVLVLLLHRGRSRDTAATALAASTATRRPSFHPRPIGQARQADLDTARGWAQSLLDHPNRFVVIDTEATGIGEDDDVIELAVVRGDREVLFASQLRPKSRNRKTGGAALKALLTDLATEPMLTEVYDAFLEALAGKAVVAWNSDFESRLIAQSCMRHGLDTALLPKTVHCAMRAYSQFQGDWNATAGSYRLHPLRGGDHSAVGDAMAVINHLEAMAGLRSVDSLGEISLTASDHKRRARADTLFRRADKAITEAEAIPPSRTAILTQALDEATLALAALAEEDVADMVDDAAPLEARLRALEGRLRQGKGPASRAAA